MKILGIETSCDETSVAIVNANRDILLHLVFTQLDDHKIHGGVVPEIAARAHVFHLQNLIERAFQEAGLTHADIDGIAATTGPGLIGGVMVGMMAGKALSLALQKPFLGINHLEAHILTARLTHDITFPYLCLLVSGGHTQIICAHGLGDYEIWASTRDDAAGECFDKSAKMMGLPFPGGPHLEKMASQCDDLARAVSRFPFTIPMLKSDEIAFSFSGLKTAVKHYVTDLTTTNGDIHERDLIDLCASFQDIIARTISYRLSQAISLFQTRYNLTSIPVVICGGVAANGHIRAAIHELQNHAPITFIAPPSTLCTDNGAMIAWAGVEYMRAGKSSPLSLKARPRWPLDELTERWIINA